MFIDFYRFLMIFAQNHVPWHFTKLESSVSISFCLGATLVASSERSSSLQRSSSGFLGMRMASTLAAELLGSLQLADLHALSSKQRPKMAQTLLSPCRHAPFKRVQKADSPACFEVVACLNPTPKSDLSQLSSPSSAFSGSSGLGWGRKAKAS